MSRFENRDQLAAKIEWEGGVLEAVDYGIRSTDMPEGDVELEELWKELEDAYSKVVSPADKISKLLDIW
jgi:hypothetical protein